jgi:hypothetical protein
MDPSPDDANRRCQWFEWYVDQLAHHSTTSTRGEDGPFACPCCRCKTLTERGGFEVCPVCCWEDDGQDDQDADVVRAGPNGGLSLTEGRANYQRCGACDQRFVDTVRLPLPGEVA